MIHQISAPFSKEVILKLKAGDSVRISGTVYTARDAAHKKMIEMISNNIPLPFDVKGQAIYYVGPCPARNGEIIGSAGPTTSSRMDAYAPKLIELGLSIMIGKGLRNSSVVEAMKNYKAAYLGAIGGAGALISNYISKQEIIAFPELGAEAIRKLTVENFETVVVIDCYGNNLYEQGKAKYCRV
jgi:fumarate hydratase subunit beta